jgi:hypothetical protein
MKEHIVLDTQGFARNIVVAVVALLIYDMTGSIYV